jgi:RHS repeat-associated protein
MFLWQGSPGIAGMPVYNSADLSASVWGTGWSSDMDHTAVISGDGSVTITDGSGAQLIFHRNAGVGTTAYTSPLGTDMALTSTIGTNNAVTSLSERDADGTTLLFSTPGGANILRLTSLTDRNGSIVNYFRDSQGRLTRVQDVHGRYFIITYNAAGMVSSLTDSGGRTATFIYDGNGNRISETGPEGTDSYAYDSNHLLTRITFPSGAVSNYTYDSQNRVLTQDDGNGVNTITFTRNTNSTVLTDILGDQTKYDYTTKRGFSVITKITDPANKVTTFSYDSNLNLASATDSLGHIYAYTYDSLGNATSTQDPAGDISRASYEPVFSQPTTLTDPLNHSTQLNYDTKGNLTQFVDPLNQQTSFSYDSFGHVTKVQDPLADVSLLAYKASNGALSSATDPLGHTAQFQTDALSRITNVTDPRGNQTAITYAIDGRPTQFKDALNNVTNVTYGPGRDSRNPTAIIDANNHSTSFQYDAIGRLSGTINALNQSGSITYDGKNRPATVVTRNGQTMTFGYDDLDRMTTLTAPEGSISLSYDAVGNLTSANHYNGAVLSMSYDALNRVISVDETLPSNTFTAALGYTYDANGNRTGMTTPWGTFRYAYDALNRVTNVTNPFGQTAAFGYDASGRRTSMTYPNGIRTTYAYDAAGQLKHMAAQNTATKSTVAFDDYTFDAAGDRVGITDASGNHAFVYDQLNRPTSVTHPAASPLSVKNETFSYDAVGNRLTDAEISDFQRDAANRLIQNSSYTYTSDASGNITSRTNRATGEKLTYVHDSANEIIEVDASTYTVATYRYDSVGRRVEKNVGGVVSRYIYDGGTVLAILDGTNQLVALFTQGPDTAPLIMHRGAGDYFYHADALGNVVALTDANGAPVEKYSYEIFGRMVVTDSHGDVSSQSSIGNPFGYAGTQFDPETKLHQMGFRYYDAAIGAFLEEDPIESINQYVYAYNDPLDYSDPSGLQAVRSAAPTAGIFSVGRFFKSAPCPTPGKVKRPAIPPLPWFTIKLYRVWGGPGTPGVKGSYWTYRDPYSAPNPYNPLLPNARNNANYTSYRSLAGLPPRTGGGIVNTGENYTEGYINPLDPRVWLGINWLKTIREPRAKAWDGQDWQQGGWVQVIFSNTDVIQDKKTTPANPQF